MAELPIHFFTIVLNGEPFIRYHLERFKTLKCAWHWHIIEGLAELKHDTAWSLQFGAQLPTDACKNGRSIDGTAEYLDLIAAENPGRITVYRAPSGRNWDGKLEMIAAPVANLPDECLLWEVDSDELWTVDQIERMREMYLAQPERTASVFYCWYFVGPGLVINRRRRYEEIEWCRTWRFRKGMKWMAHEPPTLAMQAPAGGGQWIDVARVRPFMPVELEREQLVFQHFAYVTEEQLAFKEKYYGYKNIVAQWKALNASTQFPVKLKQFLNWPWVNEAALVEPLAAAGIVPLASEAGGAWTFHDATRDEAAGQGTLVRGILMVYRPGEAGVQVLQQTVQRARAVHPDLPLHLVAVGKGPVNKRALFDMSPFEETLLLDVDAFILDRLDFGFEMARKYGMACCIGECPWMRRDKPGSGDLVEYNPGVLFFSRKAAAFFELWERVEKATPMMLPANPQYGHRIMTSAEEVAFSMALADSSLVPFILPSNWNFSQRSQRTFWGPIKIWRDVSEPAAPLVNFVKDQSREEALIKYVALGPGR